MKKTISKLFALTMAVMLLMSMLVTVSAAESYKDISECMAVNAVAAAGSISEFTHEDNAGVFGLKVSKGTDVYVIGAFLVKYGGEKYLLTHDSVAPYVEDGYELTVMVPGGTNVPAVCVAVQDAFDLAYLQANGMDLYNPLTFTDEPFTTNVVAGIAYCNEEQTEVRRIEYKGYDFSKWTQITEHMYAYEGREAELTWMGCPIFHNSTEYNVQGIGTAYEDGSGNYIAAIISFNKVNLNKDFALGAKPSSQNTQGDKEPTEAPTTPTDPTKPGLIDMIKSNPVYLILGVIAVAVVIYYVNSNNKKKQKEAAKQAAAQAVPTIPVDPTLPVAPPATHGVTRAVSNWQLRAVSGPLAGKTYPVSGTMKIGRSSKADIRFPDETAGISGSHCEVTLSGDTVQLRDVGSTYGTFVNGKRLAANTAQTLHASDSFTLAQNSASFRLERVGAAAGDQKGPAVRDMNNRTYQAGASGKLTFGRGSGNIVQLVSPEKDISSNHCELYREGGKLYLKDVGSTNGTFFSEKDRLKPNTPYQVRKGQAFFLCSAKHTFVITEE